MKKTISRSTIYRNMVLLSKNETNKSKTEPKQKKIAFYKKVSKKNDV